MHPGGSARFLLGVTNRTPRNQKVDVVLTGMVIGAGGVPEAVADAPRSAKDWVRLEPVTFTVAPEGSQTITGTVRAPRESTGGYYAMVVLNGSPEGEEDTRRDEGGLRAGVRFRYRTVVPVLVTVPGSDIRAVIKAGQPEMGVEEGRDGYQLKIPLRNDGNMHARIQGQCTIESETGQKVEGFELSAGSGFLLPEQVRKYTSKGTVNLPDGIYVARLEFTLEHGKHPMQNSFPFIVDAGVPQLAEVTEALRTRLLGQSVGFTVSPGSIELSMRPGASRSESVTLTNLTAESITITARAAEWYRNPANLDLVAHEAPPHNHSGAAVLMVTPNQIELPPCGHRRVSVRAAIPRGALGERYAAVYFETEDTSADESPRSRARHSTLVRLRAEGTLEAAAEVVSFEVRQNEKGAYDFVADFRNTGNTGFIPEVSITIRDADNVTVERLRQNEAPPFVQAGGEGAVEMEFDRVLEPGQYTAELTLRYDANQPALSARTQLNVPERLAARR